MQSWAIVKLQRREMQSRDKQMRVITSIANQSEPLTITGQITACPTARAN
jgi:hypothetical protein